MPVEELVKLYETERRNIAEAQRRQDDILRQIIAAKDKDWDMITIQKAAIKSGLSVPTLYRWINIGKLQKVEHKGSRVMVSESELKALDDRYGERGIL